MIILDTHIWIWWIDENPKLSAENLTTIEENQSDGLGISIISCWEIAKLVEKGRLAFEVTVDQWLESALRYPGIQLLPLTVPIILQSTRLEGFHSDPADQLIVATAMTRASSLVTQDNKILTYLNAQTAPEQSDNDKD
ncbi:MAG: type II toxin-antitoxin system VapC family toxin [Cyanobacteria bacterium J06642_11]